jgi:ATP-dependent Clp protease protease subunit
VQTQLFHLVGKHSGHDWKEIEEMFIRDRYMNALEAKTFGLVDQVLGNSDDVVVISKEGQIKFASEAVPNGSN